MKLFLPAIVFLAAATAVPADAGDVKLQIRNGRITLQAQDATVREILAEWGRVGNVQIVNAEKVMGTPVTLELQDVPEAQALNIVLRSVSGYMAAAKAQPTVTASIYDRVVIMATPRAALVAGGSTASPPQTQYPQYRGLPGGMPNPTMLDDQDETTAPPTYPGMPPGYQMQYNPAAARGMLGGQAQPQTGAPGGAVPGTLPQGQPGTVSPLPTQAIMPGQQVLQPGTGAPGTITTPQPPKKPGGPGGPGGE